jgi:lipopolysaccharide biosynthesis glycosyltransferase
MNREIIVAFASDDRFAQHLCVAAFSLATNLAHDRVVRIFILDGGISEANRTRISRSLASLGGRVLEVRFLPMRQGDYAEFDASTHTTHATYYRISLPELLSGTSRVLYLDCDIVVDGDVSELFDTDLDGMTVAAVRESDLETEAGYRQVLQIDPAAGFFNAGVLLMDLDAMRSSGVAAKVIEGLRTIDDITETFDQPALNLALLGRWKSLHPRWNLQSKAMFALRASSTTYGVSEFTEAKARPVILHYTGFYAKPWLLEGVGARRGRYMHYLRSTEFRDFKMEISFSKAIRKAAHFVLFYVLSRSLRKRVYRLLDVVKRLFRRSFAD